MKRIALLLLVCFSLTAVSAPKSNYSLIKTKAERFYKYEDWRSALAMYELMLAEKAVDADTYARGIVLSGIVEEEAVQHSFLERAEKNLIPYDTLFAGVQKHSLNLSVPKVYTRFMLGIRKAKPWLERMVNIRLLDFFLFRNDADNIIAISGDLLAATPDNIRFLDALGKGYVLKGQFDKSAECYRKILKADPKNYNALISLGNYYDSLPKIENDSVSEQHVLRALSCFRHAAEIRSTPYVEQRIKSLNDRLNGIGSASQSK